MRETMALTRDELRRLFVSSPLHRLLGLELIAAGPGAVTLWAPYRDDLLADSERGLVHDGVPAMLVGAAGNLAFATLLGLTVPTIDLHVDHLRAARRGHDLIASGTMVRRTGRLGVADALVVDDSGRELVVARGTYRLAH